MLLVGAAALSVVLAMPVSASVSVEAYRDLDSDSYSWVSGTDLLYKEKDSDALIVTDAEGNVISDGEYKDISTSAYNKYLSVEMDTDDINRFGLIDQTGAELVPCSYGKVTVLNRHWAVALAAKEADSGFYDDEFDLENSDGDTQYALINSADFYYIDSDGDSSKVGSLPRKNYMEATGYANYICIKDRSTEDLTVYDSTFAKVEDVDSTSDIDVDTDEVRGYKSNSLYGIKDGEGNVIADPDYESVSDFLGDYAKVEHDELFGIVDKTGKLILPAKYSEIGTASTLPITEENDYSSSGYVALGFVEFIDEDGKVGYVTTDGLMTVHPEIAEDFITNNGVSALYQQLNGDAHILAADGTDTDVSQYDSVSVLNGSSGMLYSVKDDDGNLGLIDWHGDVVRSLDSDDTLSLSGSGKYLLVGGKSLEKVTFGTDDARVSGDLLTETETEQ